MPKKRSPPWKPIAAVLVAVICVAAGAVVALRPWEGKQPGGEQPAGEENVWFGYKAGFEYRGSADNLPIENVALRFPCPSIENEGVMAFMDTRLYSWMLYWQDNENVLYPQAARFPILVTDENGELHIEDNIQVYGLRYPRTSAPEILSTGWEPTRHGPKINYVLDKLYPGEVFWISNFASVPREKADKVTLKVYGDNEGRSSSAFFKYSPLGPFEKPTDVLFWAQFSRRINDNYEVIETFSRAVDNLYYATVWLYPSG